MTMVMTPIAVTVVVVMVLCLCRTQGSEQNRKTEDREQGSLERHTFSPVVPIA